MAAAAAVMALAVTLGACGNVEWDAPEHFDDWITSNRYIDASHEAARGMAVTVLVVAAIFVGTFGRWAWRRRAAGRPLLHDPPPPVAFYATSGVVFALTCAWLATVFS